MDQPGCVDLWWAGILLRTINVGGGGGGRNGISLRSRHMGAYSRTFLLRLRLFSVFWDGPRSTVWTPSLAC